jgi:large subunit ribosomal protein L5
MNVDLCEKYQNIKPDLKKALEVKSIMAVPYISKVTLNVGMGQEASKEDMERTVRELEMISGQKPIVTYVKKSEAGFKIREGWPIGVKVTLRSDTMYRFLEHLLLVCLPAVREFNGVSRKSIDQQGNLSFGLSDYSVFRSIPFEQIKKRMGMDVCITTTATSKESGYELLKRMGFPFKQNVSGGEDGN